jgi:hypothetical protein
VVRNLILLSAFVPVFSGTATAQGIQSALPTPAILPESTPRITSELSKDVLAPVKCDPAGNVYFRATGKADQFQEPIVKISADRKTSTTFDARKVSGVPKDFIGADFAADGTGDVYQVILTRAFELFAIQYSADGTGRSKFPIHELLNPTAVSAGQSSDLLVAGTPLQMASSESPSQLVIAVFDKGGRTQGSTHRVPVQSPFEARFGGDKLYVLSGDNARVFSKTGELIKQFRLGLDDAALRLSGWYPADGFLVAEFDNHANAGEPFKGIVAVFDVATGNLRKRYRLSEEVRGGLACASEKTFIFLATEPDGHLSLVTGFVQ